MYIPTPNTSAAAVGSATYTSAYANSTLDLVYTTDQRQNLICIVELDDDDWFEVGCLTLFTSNIGFASGGRYDIYNTLFIHEL